VKNEDEVEQTERDVRGVKIESSGSVVSQEDEVRETEAEKRSQK